MTKKDLLIFVLNKLLPYRDLADGFLVLLQNTEDIQFIDELYLLISNEISSLQDDHKKKEIIFQLQKMKKIRVHQEEITEKEEEEADTMLDNFINDIT